MTKANKYNLTSEQIKDLSKDLNKFIAKISFDIVAEKNFGEVVEMFFEEESDD